MSGVFIEVRTLAGSSFVRAADVIGVQYGDKDKCTILFAGGASLPCAEAAATVAQRIEALQAAPQIPTEDDHGDAGD